MDKKALEIMNERFGHDSLISLATINCEVPFVRIVNSYYEGGSFYTITDALSNKIKQIGLNPTVAICSEWFTAHGIGENLGYICDEKNVDMADKLRTVFAEWYSNGHTDESDPNTIILRIRLTDAVLLSHGTRYDIDFNAISFIDQFKKFASGNAAIESVIVVGSHARGTSKPTSDLDLCIVTTNKRQMIENPDFADAFGRVIKTQKEFYGACTSIRVWYASGLEVELGIVEPSWIDKPLDKGTYKVLSDGYKVIVDKKEHFTNLGFS